MYRPILNCVLLLVAMVLFSCAATAPSPPPIQSAAEARTALSSLDPAERIAALEYLGDSRDLSALTLMEERLKDEDKWVRLSATLALRNLDTPRAIASFRQALQDQESDVRFAAASALFELDDYSGEPALIEGLSHPRDDFRFQALMYLGRMRSVAAIPGIISLLQDPQPRIRSAAAYILGLFRENSAIEPLLAALRDEHPWVRRDAWEALKAITGQSFEFHYDADPGSTEEEISRWKRWWEENRKALPPPAETASPGSPRGEVPVEGGKMGGQENVCSGSPGKK